MLVVTFSMWPSGSRKDQRVLSLAALDCIGQARHDAPEQGVRMGERAYRVRLFKDVAFGGPDGSGDLDRAPIWRGGRIRGHMPGARGTFDLVGGALKLLLGPRLAAYVQVAQEKQMEAFDLKPQESLWNRWMDAARQVELLSAFVQNEWSPTPEDVRSLVSDVEAAKQELDACLLETLQALARSKRVQVP